MNYRDKLINQDTGEIDMVSLSEIAKHRADWEWGGEAPAKLVWSNAENLKTLAYFMRRDWRAARGLDDDTVYVTGFQSEEPKRRWA